MTGSEDASDQRSAAVPLRVHRRAQVMRTRTDFEAVLQSGCRIASRNFLLRARPNQAPYPRLGIIAGRKAAPRAVDRNRAKRLIREVFKTSSARLGSYDVALQLRSNLRNQANRSIRQELTVLLESLARRIADEPRAVTR